jgi:hypothetical protein
MDEYIDAVMRWTPLSLMTNLPKNTDGRSHSAQGPRTESYMYSGLSKQYHA